MKRFDAIKKNRDLSYQLDDMRENFCEIGTRKTKLFLNNLVKSGEKRAELYRIALEIEDENIVAKRYWGKYRRQHYEKKSLLILKLIALCKECGINTYGYQEKCGLETSHIIYFDLPNCEQISFHCTLPNISNIPKYEGEWDGKINSTLPKLENAINSVYGELIKSKYGLKQSA